MPKRFLMCDDSVVARMLLKSVLKDIDAQIVEVGDGESALAELERDSAYDLVFLDITMPGIGGLETLKRIKRQWPALPVIMVTADVQKQTIIEVLACGAFDVIRKKIDPAVVRDTLGRLFGPGGLA